VRVVREGSSSEGYGARFNGRVELEMLDIADGPERPDSALGHFHDGAVTNWHAHPGGQHLWLVAGRGRIGTEADGEVEIDPGTLVVAPAGERHWHGAAVGSDAEWLTFTWGATAWEDRQGG
jgi:quercetin dioxygenase-like cupin family protein